MCFVNCTLSVCLLSVYLPVPLELLGRTVARDHYSPEWDEDLEVMEGGGL